MNTVYANREYISTDFLKNVGFIADSSVFFRNVNEVHKLKVLSDEDYGLLKKFAEIEDADVVEWVIPKSNIQLTDFDFDVFCTKGYLDLVAKEKISNRIVVGK